METIRIDEDRMKILLTKEDLAHYGLSGHAIDPDSEEVSRALRRLASDAGFAAGEGKLCLQLYESHGGGCELFVTRLAAEDKGKAAPRSGFLALSRQEEAVMLAKHLQKGGFRGESRLLAGGGHLFLYCEDMPPEACEFGDILPDSAAVYIEEYADPILSNGAVERLAGDAE